MAKDTVEAYLRKNKKLLSFNWTLSQMAYHKQWINNHTNRRETVVFITTWHPAGVVLLLLNATIPTVRSFKSACMGYAAILAKSLRKLLDSGRCCVHRETEVWPLESYWMKGLLNLSSYGFFLCKDKPDKLLQVVVPSCNIWWIADHGT